MLGCGGVSLLRPSLSRPLSVSSSALQGDRLDVASDWSSRWSRRRDKPERATDVTSGGEEPRGSDRDFHDENQAELIQYKHTCCTFIYILPVCASAPCRSAMQDRMVEETRLERSQRAHTPSRPSSPSLHKHTNKKRFSERIVNDLLRPKNRRFSLLRSGRRHRCLEAKTEEESLPSGHPGPETVTSTS